MTRTIWILVLLIAFLAACGTNSPKEVNHSDMNHGERQDETNDPGDTGESALKEEDVKVNYSFPDGNPKSKQENKLKIQVHNKNGNPIENFDISHEKKLHLIVVSKDLSYFNHIHPVLKDKGLFEITTQFPAGGEYKLFADFIPTGSSVMTKSEWVKVGGEEVGPIPIQPDKNLTKEVDGKEVMLTTNQLKAGEEVTLTFTIHDEKSKEPITNLEQYLGAVGHVVALTEDVDQYLHVHPMEEKTTGPDAKFMTTFPKSGIYKIWGQFLHENEVFIVPFVIEVS
ncbi:MAG TPA: hypothetical protein VGE40_02950 [Bacilli bacterium]